MLPTLFRKQSHNSPWLCFPTYSLPSSGKPLCLDQSPSYEAAFFFPLWHLQRNESSADLEKAWKIFAELCFWQIQFPIRELLIQITFMKYKSQNTDLKGTFMFRQIWWLGESPPQSVIIQQKFPKRICRKVVKKKEKAKQLIQLI